MSREIEVWADWRELGAPQRMGYLRSTPSRGKEVFSFSYDQAWLDAGHSRQLDPDLRFFSGPQYLSRNDALGGSHCGAGILPAAIFPPYSDLRMHDNNLTIGCRQRLARTGSDLGKGGGQNARATFFSAWLRLRRITLS
jgi:hypothetical protein